MEEEPKREPNRLANCVWIFLALYASVVFITLEPNPIIWEKSQRAAFVAASIFLCAGYVWTMYCFFDE